MSTTKAARGSVLREYRFLTEGSKPETWTPKQIVFFVRVLWGLNDHTYIEIAEILNKLGFETSRGKAWTAQNVGYYATTFHKFTRNEESLQTLRESLDLVLGTIGMVSEDSKTVVPRNRTTTTQIRPERKLGEFSEMVDRLETETTTPRQKSGASVAKVFGKVIEEVDFKTLEAEEVADLINMLVTFPLTTQTRKDLLIQTIRGLQS
jgi:hypothetical protein